MRCSECFATAGEDFLYCHECFNLFLGQRFPGEPPEQDERIIILADFCEELQRGDLDLAAFRARLYQFTVYQDERALEIAEVFANMMPELELDFAEEIDAGVRGINDCSRALLALAEYDPSVHPLSELIDNLVLYYNGILHIKEAMKINRRNRGRPLWI